MQKTWEDILKIEKKKDYFKDLEKQLNFAYKNDICYPPKTKIFSCFEFFAPKDLKVVIIGQDPYHGEKQATGLAFGVLKGAKTPPSLKNIFKEIKSDLNRPSHCENGDLEPWAKQGILLLNTIMSVKKSSPKSHAKIGWEEFSTNIIKYISRNFENIIFLLWGEDAKKKAKLIDEKKHFILTSSHPSGFSAYRGFLGSKHFSKTNEILKSLGKKEIIW